MSVITDEARDNMPDPELMNVFQSAEDPILTATEVAERIGVTRQYAHQRLQDLHDAGVVTRKKVGSRAVVWWPVDQ